MWGGFSEASTNQSEKGRGGIRPDSYLWEMTVCKISIWRKALWVTIRRAVKPEESAARIYLIKLLIFSEVDLSDRMGIAGPATPPANIQHKCLFRREDLKLEK